MMATDTMPKKTTKKRKPKAPCKEEAIYTSSTGATIRSTQIINEILVKGRASFVDIDTGTKPWEHPSLKPYYDSQWGDISNAVKKYGDRAVIKALEENMWCTDPRYGSASDHPLRMKKIREAMGLEASKCNVEHQNSIELPKNHVAEKHRKKREF